MQIKEGKLQKAQSMSLETWSFCSGITTIISLSRPWFPALWSGRPGLNNLAFLPAFKFSFYKLNLELFLIFSFFHCFKRFILSLAKTKNIMGLCSCDDIFVIIFFTGISQPFIFLIPLRNLICYSVPNCQPSWIFIATAMLYICVYCNIFKLFKEQDSLVHQKPVFAFVENSYSVYEVDTDDILIIFQHFFKI